MNLSEQYKLNKIINTCDKGTRHDYILGYYQNEFEGKTNINLLEIGVYKGASLLLWSNHFGESSKIYGIDNKNLVMDEFINKPNIFFTLSNAYSTDEVEKFEDEYFDYIIDDGPHTLESQLDCVKLWFSKIKKGGKLIIEDIQNKQYLEKIKNYSESYGDVKVFDLTENKGRYDDIIVEITKK